MCAVVAGVGEITVELVDYVTGDLSDKAAGVKPIMGVIGESTSNSISALPLPKKAEWVLSVGNYANGFVLDKLADTQKEDTQDEEK